ncbi:hypothetical protein Tco_1454698 [Tanacetum coccineum]
MLLTPLCARLGNLTQDYDDEEVVETASVEVDVVSGSYFINTIEIKINVVGGLMKLVVKNMKNVVECVK